MPVQVRPLHSWDVVPQQAVKIQNQLRGQVLGKLSHALPKTFFVAGADISYDKGSDRLFGAVVVMRVVAAVAAPDAPRRGEPRSTPAATIIEIRSVTGRATFPYISGFLSFRETLVLLKAFEKLSATPDVLLVDGQGLAHPRRFGIACHLGVILDIPTIGCAKSRLIGEHGKVGPRRGDWAELVVEARDLPRAEGRGERGSRARHSVPYEVIGRVVRTKDGVKPIWVSVGHKIDLDTAMHVVLTCCTRYRIPEPTRQAHLEVNRLRKMAHETR